MRIIKTSIKNPGLKLMVATSISVVAPVLSFFGAEFLPEAYKYVREGAKYSYIVHSTDINNGSLVLYERKRDDSSYETEEAIENELPKEALLLSQNISEDVEDISVFSENSGKILEITYKDNLGEDFINLPLGGQVRNCTDLSNELVEYESKKDFGIELELYSEEPQVLIMHTHTTESYEGSEKNYYDDEYNSRSFDPENGVVAVGQAIAYELSQAGISVIHDGTIHDSQYTGAYSRSLETTEEILEKYPAIKIVLDIHRDAIEDSGDRVSAVTEIEGKKAAQVMIISAADDGTYGIPNYIDNFHFACGLQQSIESRYPTLTRPVLFQYCHYNQHLTSGSLLIEVGSHGNTVDQAVYSGHLIGKSLAEMFLERTTYEQEVVKTMPKYFFDRLI